MFFKVWKNIVLWLQQNTLGFTTNIILNRKNPDFYKNIAIIRYKASLTIRIPSDCLEKNTYISFYPWNFVLEFRLETWKPKFQVFHFLWVSLIDSLFSSYSLRIVLMLPYCNNPTFSLIWLVQRQGIKLQGSQSF